MGVYRTQIDLRGHRFERALVLGSLPKTSKFARWACQCDCGQLFATTSANLRSGTPRSCGCLRRELRLRHGHNVRGNRSRTYNSWTGMIGRCELITHTNYLNYGARGITVCERWHSFENFLADMGSRPDGKTIDRYPNTNGNYEPGNCRWATNGEQARGKRKKNKTGFMGVSAHKSSGLFNARIGRDGKKPVVGILRHRRRCACGISTRRRVRKCHRGLIFGAG